MSDGSPFTFVNIPLASDVPYWLLESFIVNPSSRSDETSSPEVSSASSGPPGAILGPPAEGRLNFSKKIWPGFRVIEGGRQ